MFLSHFKVRGVSNQCFVPCFFSWLRLSILLIRIAKHLTMSGSRYSSPMRLPVDFDETLFHPAEPHRPVCGICESDLGADCYHLSWPFYSSCCGRFLCWDCFYDKSDDDIIVFSPRDDYPDTGCSGHNWTYDHSSQDNFQRDRLYHLHQNHLNILSMACLSRVCPFPNCNRRLLDSHPETDLFAAHEIRLYQLSSRLSARAKTGYCNPCPFLDTDGTAFASYLIYWVSQK